MAHIKAKPLRICYFGNYDPQYIRAAVLIKGLEKNGAELVFCRDDSSGFKKYIKLYKEHKKLKNQYDVLYVGNHDHSRTMVLFAKLLTRKKIVWDAHYSLYDAWVFDRKLIKEKSLKAYYHWVFDYLACKCADTIILDTENHVDYFVSLFKAPKSKFGVVFIGADEESFYPAKNEAHTTGSFIVEFHGKFIPLQGVEYIVQAAKKLEMYPDVSFHLIGNGQTYEQVHNIADELGVQNVNFIGKVPYSEILGHLQAADVCLGIFGESHKTKRVIPNKLYEAIAVGKPVITANTPAIHELFTDKKDILLCNLADSEDLVEKILTLRNDRMLRKNIGENVLKLFAERLTTKEIGAQLLVYLEDSRINKN